MAMHMLRKLYTLCSKYMPRQVTSKHVLLLLKTTPIVNKSGTVHDTPTNVFFGRKLKAHLSVFMLHCGHDFQMSKPTIKVY